MANEPKGKAKPVAAQKPAVSSRKTPATRAKPKAPDGDQKYIVFGALSLPDAKPAAGLTVIAYDHDESGQNTLGQTITDDAGSYKIPYGDADFRRSNKERGGADVFICIFNDQHELLMTSKKKNNAPAEYELNIQLPVPQFVVRGVVQDADGNPLAKQLVQAFERDLRHPQLLGKVKTGAGGDYRITYQSADFLLGDSPTRRAPWLIVELLESAAGKLLARQEVAKASRDQVISFTLDRAPALCEWQVTHDAALFRLKGQGAPRIEVASHVSVVTGAGRDDLAPWETTAADVDFIAEDAELNRAAVQAWADACRMARDAVARLTDEHAEHLAVLREHGWPFFYGLARQRPVSDLDALLRVAQASWELDWNAALVANRVPPLEATQVALLLQALQLLQRLQQLDPGRPAASESAKELAQVLALTPLPLPRRVALDALTIVQDKGLDDIAALLALTARYPDAEAPIRTFVRSIRVHRLAAGHQEFSRTLSGRLAGASDSIAPLAQLPATEWLSMAQEAAISPGLALRTQALVERQHPLIALEAKIHFGSFDLPGVAAGEVAALLKNQPATVEKLLLGKIPANDADSPTLKGLRNTGRFMRTGVSIELATNLGQGGIDSPGKALRYGRDFIRQQFLDLPQGAAQEVIDAFFDGAEPLLNGGKGVMLEVDINRNYPRWLMEEYELPLPDGTRENLPSFPGFFGDLDECLCRPCESMLGLPAYLVDLLNLLAKSSGKGGNALDVLRARRPDIFKLKLNCENAEKSIQHIDIVLDILEQAAMPEVAANADGETIRQLAEAKLRQAIYPWQLPFDPGHVAATAYLAKLGVSRGRLLALLPASAPAHRAAEALTTPIAQTGESSTDSQWALLTEQRRGARLWAAYGFVQESDIAISDPASGKFLSNQTVQEVLTRVSFLIECTGLSLEELEEALKTAFVAGYEWGMQLSGREQCKTSAMRLPAEGQVLEEILDRLHRFTRLWAKFPGWSITQLNDAIVLCGGSETPSTTDAERAGLLIKLTTLARLHDEFGLALVVLLENPFSEGRLRQALGLSLLQFGLLKEMTGLDLSAQAVDWPALEDFCKAARRLRDIGLAVEQGAQALLTRGRWQAVAGELPPEMKSSAQLETLLEAVRQRLRAVVEVAPELAIETQAVEALNNIFDVTRAGKIISAIHDASGPTRSAPNATMLAELLATLSGAAGHRLGEWLPLLDAASAAELFSVAATANPSSNERFTRLLVAIAARRRERELLAVLSEQCQLETAEVASLLGARLLLDAAPGEPVLANEAFLDNNFWADGASTQATPRLQTWMDRLYRLLTLRAALGIDSQMMVMAERVVVDTNAGSNTGINWRDLLGAAPATGSAAWQNRQWQALLDLLWLQQPEQLGRPALDELLRRLGASGAQLVADTLRPMTARLDIAETLALPLVAQALDLPSGATPSGDPLLNPQKLRLAFEWLSIARQLGASASQMAQLMNPASNALAAATSKQLLEAKLSGDAVPGSLQKIGDALRRQRRDALVAYHVAQVVGRNNSDKWKDAKALYEHFLIDPQMEPCFATTRLLEAVSAVQLFAQRILFGIEPQITADRELKQRWVWMRNYRVWEANRKVFLFPENWLFPELRDDKSTSFKQLESALGQGELNQELANQTFGQFLDDVSQMGQVQVLGMYEDLSRDASGTLLKDRNNRYPLRRTLYVIGRTPNLPYAYFWRHCVDFGSPDMAWLPWQRIELDIQGDHVLPFVLGGNLCVAWPLIRRITQEAAEDSWEVKLAWSRHDGKAWRKTSVSREAWSDKASPFGDEREGFAFRCEATPDGSKSKIIVYVASEVAGTAISKPPTLQNIGGTPGFVLGDDFRPYRASDGVAPSSVRLAKLLDDGYDHIPNVVNANTYSPKQHLIVYAMINAYWGSDGTIGGGANPLYADMFKNSIHGDRIIFSNPALAIRQHFDALRNDPNLVIPTDIFIKQQIGTFISDYMDYSRSKTNYVAFNGFITALDPACAHADVQCEVWLRVTSGRSDLVKLRGDEGVFSCLIENSNLTPRDSIQFTKLGAITERPVTLTLTIDGRPLDSISETLGAVSPGFQSSKKLIFEVNGRSLSREQLDRIGVNISSQQSLVNVAEFDLPHDGFIKKMPGSRSPLLSQVANSRPWMNGIQESRLGPSWPFALARNGAADTIIFAATGSPGFWAVGSASSYPHDQLPPSWHYAEDDKAACYIDFASAAEGRSTDGLYVFPDTYKESAVRYSSWLESNELPAPQESTFGAIALPLPAVGNAAAWDAVKGGDRTFDARLPYACYNWEVFFHAPLLVADQLSKQHKFEDAERWLRCVFDPTSGGPEANSDRFLKFQVFKDLDLKRQVIDDLTALAQAAGGFATESDIEGIQKLIDRWRDTPFRPFVIARRRQIAFLWRTLFAYLDNLLAWADSLYRRDTRESINEATMLYVLAERILGRRPQVHQGTSNRPAVSYDEKISKWDEFANFWIDVGGYSQSNRPTGWRPKDPLDQPNPDGMLYFCMPFNDKILSYWNTVDACLGNIRNCRNIEGITRSLPFMDAPIDPELLVRATAARLDLGEVIAGLYAPPPHYRYNVLASRAAELVNEARSLGAAMLSAIEKRDAEHLAQLRSSNEINLLKLVGDVRKLQITEASGNIEALRASRRSISARYGQYQRLLGNKDIKTPKENESAGEEAMLGTVDSGLASARSNWGLIKEEDQQYFGIEGANTWSLAANIAKFTGGGFHMAASILAPNPLDKITNAAEVAKAIGTASSLVGDGFSMVSQGWRTYAEQQGMMAGHIRRRDEWAFQSNQTLKEMQQIDKQILANQIRINITQKEFDNHIQQIEQATAVDEVMRSKFSNGQLYEWMKTELSRLYFSAYRMAVDMARRAQSSAARELGVKPLNILRNDYWDSLRDGLLAGERLHQDLKRLDIAYLDCNRREYELTKHISLRRLDPQALVKLRVQTAGECQCEFKIPEWLFDLDTPGHYLRRIKSVSVSIPSVTGPYSSVNCKLTLLKSEVRHINTGATGLAYLREQGQDDARFTDYFGATEAIVTSTANADSGMFETQLRDERFLPFEGGGVISTWRLELPGEYPQFDYSTISDVVLTLRYTAREGGDSLRHAATAAIQEQLRPSISGANRKALRIPVLLSCRADFPNEWARAIPGVNLEIPITRDLLPYWMEAVRIGSGNSARKLSVCQVLVGDLLKAPPATPRFITVWPPDPPPSVPPEWPENPLNSGSLPNNVADRFILLGVGLQ